MSSVFVRTLLNVGSEPEVEHHARRSSAGPQEKSSVPFRLSKT